MLIHPQFDPIAIALGPLKVHWYGLTYLAAFALFYLFASARAKQPYGFYTFDDLLMTMIREQLTQPETRQQP